MITAKEAYEKSLENKISILSKIEKNIESKIKKGYTDTHEYVPHDSVEMVLSELKKLGYTAAENDLSYSENACITISWNFNDQAPEEPEHEHEHSFIRKEEKL